VLVPLDGSVFAERALDEARRLLTDTSTLVLLEVVPTLERTVRVGEVIAPLADTEETLEAVERADAYLTHLRAQMPELAARVETRVRVGTPADEITAATDEERIDLVVMASHGRTGPARWWLGSVADAVVRHARTPVFLISARALAPDGESLDGRLPTAEVLDVMSQ
jgi:nucleotide-binding universal stress UspA family protein